MAYQKRRTLPPWERPQSQGSCNCFSLKYSQKTLLALPRCSSPAADSSAMRKGSLLPLKICFYRLTSWFRPTNCLFTGSGLTGLADLIIFQTQRLTFACLLLIVVCLSMEKWVMWGCVLFLLNFKGPKRNTPRQILRTFLHTDSRYVELCWPIFWSHWAWTCL